MDLFRIAAQRGITLPTAKVVPQKRATSQPITRNQPVEVRLLVRGDLPVQYTRAGKVAKRQPAPMLPGETAWAKLRYTGEVNLYPFEMAGEGYELVSDAEEGVHYEFVE
jgi:hypothetical protein